MRLEEFCLSCWVRGLRGIRFEMCVNLRIEKTSNVCHSVHFTFRVMHLGGFCLSCWVKALEEMRLEMHVNFPTGYTLFFSHLVHLKCGVMRPEGFCLSCWVKVLEGMRLAMHVNFQHDYKSIRFIQFIWHAESCVWKVFVLHVESCFWKGLDLKCMSVSKMIINLFFLFSSFDMRSHASGRVLSFMLSQGAGRDSIWNAHQFSTWSFIEYISVISFDMRCHASGSVFLSCWVKALEGILIEMCVNFKN